MNKRTKDRPPELAGHGEALAAMREVAQTTLELNALVNERDSAIQIIKEESEERESLLKAKLSALTASLHAWADKNPEAFQGAKSLRWEYGVMGWRRNTPSLKARRGWTLDGALAALRASKLGQAFIRVKEEINKEQLIAERETLGDTQLEQWGLRIEQREDFYVEPNITKPETRQKEAA